MFNRFISREPIIFLPIIQIELRFGRLNNGHLGILVISEKYEFLFNKSNKEKEIFYYYCKNKRTKASLVKVEINGESKYHLKNWSDDHNHFGCAAEGAAKGMKHEMMELVKSSPEDPVAVAREKNNS